MRIENKDLPPLRAVKRPDGSKMTVGDLPPANVRRWLPRYKADVVTAVRGGLLGLEEACQRYQLTVDEFLSWQRLLDAHGNPGLRAMSLQDYRR